MKKKNPHSVCKHLSHTKRILLDFLALAIFSLQLLSDSVSLFKECTKLTSSFFYVFFFVFSSELSHTLCYFADNESHYCINQSQIAPW